MPDDVMISLETVSKVFASSSSPAVDRLSLDIRAGEIVTMVGPSGCGKTTTLKMINRLIEPTSGRITIQGEDIMAIEPHALRREIGYVIQQIGLFPHKTIHDNIGTVPRLLGWDRDRISARVTELIDLVDLDPDMLSRYPSELSGGQRQRAGVARALAADPPVLLMDEPFGAVDPIVRGRLQDELLALQERVHKTIVFVTHDIDEALKLADRIAILNVGGVLEQYGTPEDILRAPNNPFVEDFIGSERGLKRLALLEVASLDVGPGPVVERGAEVEGARAVMDRYGTSWVGITSGDELLGWVWGHDLDGPGVATAPLHPFLVRVSPSSTLREALDAIITSRTEVAVVTEGERFLGMLQVTDLVEELQE